MTVRWSSRTSDENLGISQLLNLIRGGNGWFPKFSFMGLQPQTYSQGGEKLSNGVMKFVCSRKYAESYKCHCWNFSLNAKTKTNGNLILVGFICFALNGLAYLFWWDSIRKESSTHKANSEKKIIDTRTVWRRFRWSTWHYLFEHKPENLSLK